jgi:hypothetical protein
MKALRNEKPSFQNVGPELNRNAAVGDSDSEDVRLHAAELSEE